MEGSKRIVVIDDCRLTLAIISDILKNAGYRVDTAETGIEANNHIYSATPPDLIIIDLIMPMLGGDRKISLIKKRESSKNIPVLLISSRPEAELNDIANLSGADGYVRKPISKDVLLTAVQGLL